MDGARSIPSAHPGHKFIQTTRPELYDLTADPHERTNIFDTHRVLAWEMAKELDRRIAESSRGAGAGSGEPR